MANNEDASKTNLLEDAVRFGSDFVARTQLARESEESQLSVRKLARIVQRFSRDAWNGEIITGSSVRTGLEARGLPFVLTGASSVDLQSSIEVLLPTWEPPPGLVLSRFEKLLKQSFSSSEEELPLWFDAFDAILSDPNESESAAQWIAAGSDAWIASGAPALAAVIEAATHHRVVGVGALIAATLECSETHERAASVAAQRTRLIQNISYELRTRIAAALLERVKAWESVPDTAIEAARAIPSIVVAAPSEIASAFLVERVTHGATVVASAACQGAIDWCTSTSKPESQTANLLFDAAAERLIVESGTAPGELDIAAMLIWLIGASATSERLTVASNLLSKMFTSTNAVGSAAAVRGGRLLVQRHGGLGLRALMQAIGDGSEQAYRYGALLVDGTRLSRWL